MSRLILASSDNLDLGEIRNMIYEYALTATQGEVDIHRVRDSDTGARTKPMRQTKNAGKKKYKDIAHQLLRANKKIHAEAAPVLYKVNTFRFYDVQDLTIFFGCHAVHVRHLSSITVWAPVYLQQGPLTQQHIETAFSMLAFAENLNYLQLEVVWSKTGRLDDAVRAFFEAARNWLQAVGLRKGSKKAGMDVLDVRQVHIHGRSGWDTRRPWEEFTPLLETKLVS